MNYRIEREPMARGQVVPLFRVIVKLPRNRWGTVQAGLDRDAADGLLKHLTQNETAKAIFNMPWPRR